jgi:hypothetical protein
MDLRKNDDGSVDIYCGPKAPAGFEKNWIPTVPGKNWFRTSASTGRPSPHFDRSWPLPDFERLHDEQAATRARRINRRHRQRHDGAGERLENHDRMPTLC